MMKSRFSVKGFIKPLSCLLLGLGSAFAIAGNRSDDNPTIESWGKDFPEYVEMYMAMQDTSQPTEFGGNTPYSKLIRYPAKTVLWAGYAFAIDFNEDRSHYYSQIDQMTTKRNDRAYLNAHGLKKFKGQPGACMNCHSGWTPALIREMGWENFNREPYWDTIGKIEERHGKGLHGSEMGSTCADCHHPDDMSLRVTRPAYINAMVARGYEADPKSGLKGSQQEMGDHVCQQCHVEYYFKGPDKLLTFPWNTWPKGQPFKIEMMEAYYEAERAKPDGFKQDWPHAITKAPMLKMQHPEAEMSSGGPHAAMGVTCSDCHMPQVDYNGKQVTNHTIASPLRDMAACGSCHGDTDALRETVVGIQRTTANAQHDAEAGLLMLIADIKTTREEMAKQAKYKAMKAGDRDAAISAVLAKPLDLHRRASMRWNFVGAENSTGAHNPAEAMRILKQSVELSAKGQQELLKVAKANGVKLSLSTEAVFPAPPSPIRPGDIVGSVPPEWILQADAKRYEAKKAAQGH